MKIKLILFILSLQLLILAGCQVNQSAESSTELSDLQIQACNSADEAGTCETRLSEVGIVLVEECCQQLGECC